MNRESVTLADLPLRDELRNPRAETFNHRGCVIGRPVIGNDDLHLGRDLRGDALEEFAEKPGAVARRDAEREKRCGRVHGREVKRRAWPLGCRCLGGAKRRKLPQRHVAKTNSGGAVVMIARRV